VGLARLNSRLKFTEQHIELLFNAPLTMQPLPYIAAASCNLVLSRKTLLQLGSDPVCFLVTSVEYRIRFGIGSSIMPSDTVVFLSTFGVAAAGSKLSSFDYGQEYMVRVPSNVPAIVPIVIGSDSFGSCVPLILDGSRSLNSFGRPFTRVAWNLSWEYSTIDATFSNASQFEKKSYIEKSRECLWPESFDSKMDICQRLLFRCSSRDLHSDINSW